MNTIGTLFRFTSFGESHGPAVGGIIDGCPAGLRIDNDFIASELNRRRLGDDIYNGATTARREPDQLEWLSGFFNGVTLGTPIAFAIRNKDCRSSDYDELSDAFRPGHADYVYQQKYHIRDHRGGGRSSGRETVARVVAGAIAKQLLRDQGIVIDAVVEDQHVSCTIKGLAAGIGNPIFGRLNALLSFAMLSIPSAMGFVMGDTPDAWHLPQQQFPDQWQIGGSGDQLTQTNHCGGIQGGITNGMPVQFHVAFHLPVTNTEDMNCLCTDGKLKRVKLGGRHDCNHLSRLPVIVESMAALVVINQMEIYSNINYIKQ